MLRFWYGVVCIGIDIGNPGQGILADFIPSNGEYIYTISFCFVLSCFVLVILRTVQYIPNTRSHFSPSCFFLLFCNS